jgi:hypothetical protein
MEQFVVPTHRAAAPYNVVDDFQTLNIPVVAPWAFIYLNCSAAITVPVGMILSNQENLPVTATNYGMPYLDLSVVLPSSDFTSNYLHVGDVNFFMTAAYGAGSTVTVNIFERGFDGGDAPPGQVGRWAFAAAGGSAFGENIIMRIPFRHGPARVLVQGTAGASCIVTGNPVRGIG